MKKLHTNKTILLIGGMVLNVLLGYDVTKLNTAYLSLEAFGMPSDSQRLEHWKSNCLEAAKTLCWDEEQKNTEKNIPAHTDLVV